MAARRLLASPLTLVRAQSRVAVAQKALAPPLARTFLIDVKPTKKSTSTSKASPSTSSSSSSSPSSQQDSKYRIEDPSAAVVAFAHRLGLDKLKDQTLWMRIITHQSYERVGIQTNERLDFLGQKALDLFVLEYLGAKYPKMPVDMLHEAVQIYTRTRTLAIMGKEMGVEDVARWTRSKPDSAHQLTTNTVKASVIRAIIGALYRDQGLLAAREFVHKHFLSRELDISSLLELEEPKRYLSVLMKRLGRETPVARLLSETGRLSKHPVFVVGVYSGTEKIGEGFGYSLAMAENRANKDALQKYYLEEFKEFQVPTDVEKEGVVYKPNKVGDTPVVV